jgi:hypothetical protein
MNPIWKEIKNFQELQECMVKFLEGKYKSNPWHLSPVDPETVPILQKLRKINKAGFVTIDGQPGNHTKDDDGTESYQRGFIQGFIEKKNFLKLTKALLKTGKVLIAIKRLDSEQLPYHIYGDYESLIQKSKDGRSRINLTKEIFPSEEHPFLHEYLDTEERGRLCIESNGRVIRYYTNFWLDTKNNISRNLSRLNPKLTTHLEKYTFGLYIIRKEYGKGDLEDIVLNALKK